MAITINGNGTITGISAGGLPSGSVTAATLASGLATQGITEFDMWRVHSDFNQATATITANWERADVDFEKIGTGLTESSGIFTFPSTGKYLVGFSVYGWNSAEKDYIGGKILLRDSGGTFQVRQESLSNTSDDTLASNSYSITTFDIVSTSANVMKFQTVAPSSTSFNGSTTQQRTGFWTMRLGDT
jgi:glutaredoxin-related protein